jgi:hypothetical protein
MYENMVGPVGFVMHEDRLAQATKNRRLVEAEEGQRTAGKVHYEYREAMGKAMLTLAARIAPQIALPEGHRLATDR